MRMSTLLLSSLLLSTAALGADRPAKLLELLRAPDIIPSAADLRSVGAGDRGEVLALVAADRAEARYVRMRAASMLSLFATVEAKRAAIALCEAADDDLAVRIQAVVALGQLEGAAALPRFERLLGAPEADLRAAVVRALLRIEDPRARALVVSHRTREPSAAVRAVIDRSLLSR